MLAYLNGWLCVLGFGMYVTNPRWCEQGHAPIPSCGELLFPSVRDPAASSLLMRLLAWMTMTVTQGHESAATPPPPSAAASAAPVHGLSRATVISCSRGYNHAHAVVSGHWQPGMDGGCGFCPVPCPRAAAPCGRLHVLSRGDLFLAQPRLRTPLYRSGLPLHVVASLPLHVSWANSPADAGLLPGGSRRRAPLCTLLRPTTTATLLLLRPGPGSATCDPSKASVSEQMPSLQYNRTPRERRKSHCCA